MDRRVTNRHGLRLFNKEGVVVTVDSWVDAEAKKVLMIWSHNTRCYDGAAGDRLSQVDGSCGEDSRGSNFVVNCGVLGELECEDVVVVGNCDDRLKHENA